MCRIKGSFKKKVNKKCDVTSLKQQSLIKKEYTNRECLVLSVLVVPIFTKTTTPHPMGYRLRAIPYRANCMVLMFACSEFREIVRVFV